MREIKFRACDDRKHYAPIMLDFEYLKTLSINQWSGFKVMQYTGLEDKNGVEVWENYINKYMLTIISFIIAFFLGILSFTEIKNKWK